MAMRENTGLQIALILFVMITVVLAVTTYMYFDSANKSQLAEETATNKANDLERDVEKLNAQIEALRGMMGYEFSEPALTDIESNFAADMAKFGEGYEEKRDYRVLPQYLSTRVVELNKSLADEKLRLVAKNKELEDARAQEQQIVAKQKSEFDEAVDEYNTEKDEFATQRTKTVAIADGIQAAYDEASREVSTIKATKDKEIDALSQRVAKLDLLQKTLTDKIDTIQNPASVGKAERPDGKVTWVSQRGGMVYVNLGSADGLRRATMFTVYDAGTVNLAQAEPKASIEVTTIRGPHLAEARIIEDQISNPILSQDNIYSPVWNPGQKVHFALVGFMDIDNDRKSDRRLVRSLIAQNGGTVDAEVLDDGSREGKLTINTRYVVEGERPTDKSNADSLRAYSQMVKEASELGIEKISVERLLSDMGWRGSERTLGAGDDPSGGTFKPKPKETRESGNPGFQPRTRPGGQTRRGSAY